LDPLMPVKNTSSIAGFKCSANSQSSILLGGENYQKIPKVNQIRVIEIILAIVLVVIAATLILLYLHKFKENVALRLGQYNLYFPRPDSSNTVVTFDDLIQHFD